MRARHRRASSALLTISDRVRETATAVLSDRLRHFISRFSVEEGKGVA